MRRTITMRRISHLRALLALLVAAAVAVGVLVVVGTKPAEAAFPGANGLIVFESNRSIDPSDPRSTDFEIFTVDPDDPNNTLTQLTVNSTYDGEPAWSPDGEQIAFSSVRDGTVEIHKMDAAPESTTNPAVRLTTEDNIFGMEPAWSPDGARIAFRSFDEAANNYNIYVIDAVDGDGDGNGDNKKRLTKHSAHDGAPSWSPDGKKIAFTSSRSGDNRSDIYVMKARPEGKKNRPKNLTKNPEGDASPNWSPDSPMIAFDSFRDGDGEIYVMNADGSEQTNITDNPEEDEYSPAWSPDGSKMAFLNFDLTSEIEEIYVLDATSGSRTNITNTNDPAISYRDPDWQPIPPP